MAIVTTILSSIWSTLKVNLFSISLTTQLILTVSLSYYGTKHLQTGTTVFESCDIGDVMITEYENEQKTVFDTTAR